MKTTLLIMLCAGLFALPLALPGAASADMGIHGEGCEGCGMMQEEGMGMGGGMGMGMGMGPGGCESCGPMQGRGGGDNYIGLKELRMMNLNPDQRTRLNKIENDLRKQQWTLMGRVLDERSKLYDLYSAERPDPKRIGQVYGTIFDLRQQMIEARIDAANRGKDILTKEQIDKLRQLKQSHGSWGAGGGDPHHGMMMQDMMGSGGTGSIP